MLPKLLFCFLISTFVVNTAEARKTRVAYGAGHHFCDLNGDGVYNWPGECNLPGASAGSRCNCNPSARTFPGKAIPAKPADFATLNSLTESQQLSVIRSKGSIKVDKAKNIRLD